VLKAILILALCTLAGCSKPEEPQAANMSDAELSALVQKIENSGAKCGATTATELIDVQIHDTPHLCIPLINQLPRLDTVFFSCDGREVSAEDFSRFKTRPETKDFFTLYGTLSRDAFAQLAEKFPNIEELTLWGFEDSDLTALPPLPNLRKLRTEWEQPVTAEEARRIALSQNLEDITIDQGQSKEVFDILRQLPHFKALAVSTFDAPLP